MIYITGDTHRDFDRVERFCRLAGTTTNDVLIILGDVGINYREDFHDDLVKKSLAMLPITLFCIHGNHEARPTSVKPYKVKGFHGGPVIFQEQYPNILFACDGHLYEFNGNKCCVCGGAYSVDKPYRLATGQKWFADEQPSEHDKQAVKEMLSMFGYSIDCMLTHTCPKRYIPLECFLPGIDSSDVDQTTELFFDDIEEKLRYKRWYCGHFHTNKRIDRMTFLYDDIIELRKE